MDGTDKWPYMQYTAGRCYEDDDNEDDDDTAIQGIVMDVHNTCTWWQNPQLAHPKSAIF